MIRVTVEMLPGGLDLGADNEILGVMLIGNTLGRSIETSGRRGDYRVKLWKKRNAAEVIAACGLGADSFYKPWAESKVENFPRKSQHVWNLVRRALNNITAEQSKASI